MGARSRSAIRWAPAAPGWWEPWPTSWPSATAATASPRCALVSAKDWRRSSRRSDATRDAGDTGRAMSQENVELVRRMWDAWLAGDVQGALSFYDPDVEWDGTNLPDGHVARGHEAIL